MPRLQARLASLLVEEAAIHERLRDNQHRINARMQENEILRVQQENFVLQARAIGKIIQYVETAGTGNAGSNLRKQIDIARSRVALLEIELDPEAIREKLNAFTNIIGRYMKNTLTSWNWSTAEASFDLIFATSPLLRTRSMVPSRCSGWAARKTGSVTMF